MIAARIARRLARKAVKPLALRLVDFRVAQAQAQAKHFKELQRELAVLERDMRVHAVQLVGRRNQIRSW